MMWHGVEWCGMVWNGVAWCGRVLIERLRPLDQKLTYRVQKLLKLAASEEEGAEASEAQSASAGVEPPRPSECPECVSWNRAPVSFGICWAWSGWIARFGICWAWSGWIASLFECPTSHTLV
jgi:hypothetical protein